MYNQISLAFCFLLLSYQAAITGAVIESEGRPSTGYNWWALFAAIVAAVTVPPIIYYATYRATLESVRRQRADSAEGSPRRQRADSAAGSPRRARAESGTRLTPPRAPMLDEVDSPAFRAYLAMQAAAAAEAASPGRTLGIGANTVALVGSTNHFKTLAATCKAVTRSR